MEELPVRESGIWIRRKHHYLRRYCDMFTKGMKHKWSNLCFLDLLSGPGICRIRETGELLPGSPLIALEYDFTEYRFVEADSDLANALKKRISDNPKASACKVNQVKWEEYVTNSGFGPLNGLTLAFVDPTGISQVPWQAMRVLASSSQRIDILMTIQHGMGINLNKHQYLSKDDETAVDHFLGRSDWRVRLKEGHDFESVILDEYTSNMRDLGFDTRKWILIKNDAGVGLYYLCLFARHTRALEFWDQVVLKDEKGQRSMDF